MKQTAVEWLVNELTHKIGDEIYISIDSDDGVSRLVEIALEKERRQVIHAHMEGSSLKAEAEAVNYYNLFYKQRK
jgi:hypothetical protein